MNRTNLIEDFTLLPLPAWWESPWVWLGAVLGLALFAWLGSWWWRRWAVRLKPVSVLPPEPDRTPDFLARLAQLRARQGQLSAYDLAIECSDLLREYVEWRFRLAIRFQTTREFLEAAARDTAMATTQRDWLGRYLRFCDLVKFARQGATPAEQSNLLDSAETFLRGGTSVPIKPAALHTP